MANLIIKPTSGGNLILQDEGGDAAVTVGTTGSATFAQSVTLSGTTNNICTVTAGNTDAINDVVKIAGGAFTVVNEIDVQGCFTSAYNLYKLYLMGGSGTAGYRRIAFLDSSNALIQQSYYIRIKQEYSASTSGIAAWDASSTINCTDQNHSQGFQIDNTWQSDTTTEESHLDMTIMNPMASSTTFGADDAHAFGTSLVYSGSSQVVVSQFGVNYQTNGNYDGLHMTFSSGNINAYNYQVYGYNPS